MKLDTFIPVFLVLLLVLTAAITVTSRTWMLESHRELRNEEKLLLQHLDKERELKLELVTRTDLNTVERRAREELGMKPLRHDQWLPLGE
ncbi:MAG: cell division protein FtsL [Magnetococcales bacterium]|nr:cell division protein FtsL [Magnetococcales bacterium]MBF0151678.1 cell division protein FtsL [Magnetococcales bacterium]MBF0171963.1 cell division protein FtsL [Magnetococcales bacterium]MBF0348582.1 cell division protein FtsL [Magnetococcales bacterium]MBF0631192.1 cell division protein FtsL [Magnetococcales bacterium]